MSTGQETQEKSIIEALFGVGAHIGYSRARRHASARKFIFGAKGAVDIIDITKTSSLLSETEKFVESLGAQQKTILFVGGKPEIRDITREAADSVNMPVVAGRWLGGTLTNFNEIKKRIQRLATLLEDKESGSLAKKYTKRERVLIDREIAKLDLHFGGLSGMDRLPDALVVVDTRSEHIAVSEAHSLHIPVVGIMNSDSNFSVVSHPIPANDSSRDSVQFILQKLVEAYQRGRAGVTQ